METSYLTQIDERDRISYLPECLLHHIFSLLDMKQVVQTSVLSRRWRYFWKHLPILNFDHDLRSYKDMEWGFERFVNRVFKLRDSSSNIQRVRATRYCPRVHNRWIRTAVRGNLQQLYLDGYYPENFRLPHFLFTCKSLTILELRSCNRLWALRLPDSMSLPTLKTLLLHFAWLEGDDVLNKIFSSCPVLESFTMERCHFEQTNIDISAFQLKHLVIENYFDDYYCSYWSETSIRLYAPNLISFRCGDIVSTDYSIENLSALAKAEIVMRMNCRLKNEVPRLDDMREQYAEHMMRFLRALNNVEALTLSTWLLEVISGAPSLLESKSIQFRNLRCLKLHTWLSTHTINAVTHLLSIFPNIESLLLAIDEGQGCSIEDLYGKQSMYQYGDEVRFNSAKSEVHPEAGDPLQCMLYHLKFVEIREVKGSLNEMKFLAMLLKNAMVLEKVALYTSEKQSPRTKKQLIKFTEQLLSLPRASSSIAILLL